jgi:hypothetical protein
MSATLVFYYINNRVVERKYVERSVVVVKGELIPASMPGGPPMTY